MKTLYVFTDPMMGLSYEAEPVLEKLKEHCGDNLQIRYVMAGLVRDVSDFMTPEELALPPAEGIRNYNKRLAQIYLDEIHFGGLPMNMKEFHLFDEEHRSSWPLDIAFEAARLIAPDKSEAYLYALRRATIVEGRQTTLVEELANIAGKVGIDKDLFLEYYNNGKAEKAFMDDMRFARSIQISTLPSYLVKCDRKSSLVCGMPTYEDFLSLIKD